MAIQFYCSSAGHSSQPNAKLIKTTCSMPYSHGIVYPKIIILSSFSHPRAIPNKTFVHLCNKKINIFNKPRRFLSLYS